MKVVRVSSNPVGSLWACKRCPSKTFDAEGAETHTLETGHETYPLFEVGEVDGR